MDPASLRTGFEHLARNRLAGENSPHLFGRRLDRAELRNTGAAVVPTSDAVVAAEIERETHSGRKSPLPTVAVVPPLFERHFNLLLSIVIVGVHDDQNVLRSNVDADSVAL